MTDEASRPEAQEKPKGKKAWQEKPPSEWLRTTPMGRQEIVDELVGLPDHYIQNPDGKGKDGKPTKHAGKRIPVPTACVKAVVRCIAGWDAPGAEFFRGNENIAHCTGWPVSMVNKANLAMKRVGLLTKERRGWDETSFSDLDWDAIQCYRRRYCPKPGIKEKLPTPADEVIEDDGEQSGDGAQAQPVATRLGNLDPLTGEVLDWFAAAKIFNQQELARLAAQDVDKVITGLRKLHHDDATIRGAILSLDNRQLDSVIRRARKPARYLRTVLMKVIEEGVEVAEPEGKGDIQESEEEKRLKDFAENFTWQFAAYWNNDANKPKPEYSHLVPAFQQAITNHPNGKWMSHYIQYAFWKDHEYFRKVNLDQASRTFLKQLQTWISRYHDEFPDPETEWRLLGETKEVEDVEVEDADEDDSPILWNEEDELSG